MRPTLAAAVRVSIDHVLLLKDILRDVLRLELA